MPILSSKHLPDGARIQSLAGSGNAPSFGHPHSGSRYGSLSAASMPRLMKQPVRKNSNSICAAPLTLPHENEDTRITGGTRSLIRRLLALNVGGSLANSRKRPAQVIGDPAARTA